MVPVFDPKMVASTPYGSTSPSNSFSSWFVCPRRRSFSLNRPEKPFSPYYTSIVLYCRLYSTLGRERVNAELTLDSFVYFGCKKESGCRIKGVGYSWLARHGAPCWDLRDTCPLASSRASLVLRRFFEGYCNIHQHRIMATFRTTRCPRCHWRQQSCRGATAAVLTERDRPRRSCLACLPCEAKR
jgi:hypothetical protein